jgi:putative transposase
MEANEQLKQLLKEHVKQQKTTTGISNFLQDIFKEAVQEMLKAEMDNHLGYEKHASDASQFSNNRNGKTAKKVRSSGTQLPVGETYRDKLMK